MGEETFRAGVNAYLKQHQYGNATASDFWDAQAKTSKKPVDKIMPTWVKQAGVPIINVKSQCSGELHECRTHAAEILRGPGEILRAERSALADSALHEGFGISTALRSAS